MQEKPEPGTAAIPEDRFFVLRYCREQFQRRIEEIAREAGISSAPVLAALSVAIGEAHDKLAASAERDGFSRTSGLTASSISLVGNDDLELDIRINDLIQHLKNNDRIDHWRVQLRYMTLLERPGMSMENSPLGLEPIRQGLWALSRASGVDLEQQLDQIEALEKALQDKLPEVYTELNGLLEHHGINTAPAQIVRRPDGKPVSEAASFTSRAGNALASLQHALWQREGGLPPALPGGSGNTTENGLPASAALLNASAMMMLKQLSERLQALEKQRLATSHELTTEADAPPSPLRVWRSQDVDLPPGSPAAVALDTLALIFEVIFADPELPEAVKAAIGRLQIPLLRQAIANPHFFSDTQHPARQLINRLAHAALGLPPETGYDDPLCIRLKKVAQAACNALDAGTSDLSAPRSELDTLIAEREQAVTTAAQPFLRLLAEHEAHTASQAASREWLMRTTAAVPYPEIRQFLAQCWLPAMQSAHLEGGASGERWVRCNTAVAELLWSFQAKETADERKQLLLLIPALLKRINAELDQAGISTEARKPFLDACFELQTAALRNRKALSDRAVAEENAAMPEAAPEEAVWHTADGRSLLCFPPGAAERPPGPQRGSAWPEGSWIAFRVAPEKTLYGRLCARSASGTLLLYNPAWPYAVALPPAQLERQLHLAQARIVSATPFFDRAAQLALEKIGSRPPA